VLVGQLRDPQFARAAVLLARAVTLPSMREALRRDPQLGEFVTSSQYKATFLPDPRTDFFELAPLAPHTRVLATLAYSSPESLATAAGDPNLLVVLGVSGRTRVIGLAQLCLDLADDPVLRPVRIEILHELGARRLLTPADLAVVPHGTREVLSATVTSTIGDRCKPQDPALTSQALVDWWDSRYPIAVQ
jgi:hypothetical protein